MVEVQNVTKRYGGRAVVDAVSVNIPRGKITSLIGPNGAGKSTLLSMISRLVPKDEGEIRIDGRELGSVKHIDLAKKLSILKQSNHLQIRLKVRELLHKKRLREQSLHMMELERRELLQHKRKMQLGQRMRMGLERIHLKKEPGHILKDEDMKRQQLEQHKIHLRMRRSHPRNIQNNQNLRHN